MDSGEYLEYFENLRKDFFYLVDHGSLSSDEIKHFLLHIPDRKISGYPNEVYEFCNSFVNDIKEYAKSKGINL